MKFSGQIQSGNAVAWICVATPNKRQHVQAVPAGEFLIGSGPLCHLRLGDGSIPERLVGMTVDAHTARFVCLASSPAVYLNGEPTLEGVLHDGDVLELGPYGLVFRTVWENAQLVSSEVPVHEAKKSTARELVDAISDEMEIVSQHERTTATGLKELVAAVQANDSRVKPLGSFRSSGDIQTALEAIERNQMVLQLQHDQILDVLSEIARQQEAIAESVQSPANRGILQMPDPNDRLQHRASA